MAEPQARPARVLVVDDNALNRRVLSRGLEEEGHRPIEAENGRLALEILRAEPVDVVLLDLVMPELDGTRVLEQLQADPALRHLPVIMVSAEGELDNVVRCLELGAEDYLPKPVNPLLLKARLGACLAKKRLRDQELEYLHNVDRFIAAATDVESGRFDPVSLDPIAVRPDPLGHFAQIFQRMAREVAAREEELRQRLQATQFVFLSYASADRDRVLPIADRLEAAGIRVWVDRHEIAGGTNYGTEIVQGIRSCSVLAIACSDAGLHSRNVKQEIQLAWKYQRPYLPLLLDSAQIPEDLEYWLEGCQWVEVLGRGESVWLPEVLQALDRFGVTPGT